MKQLKSVKTYTVTGKGKVFVVDRQDIKLNEKVRIDDTIGKVIGIETASHTSTVGLILRSDK